LGPALVGGQTEGYPAVALGQASDPGEGFWIDATLRPAEPLTLRPGPRQPSPDAFHYATAFELGDRPDDLQLKPAGGRRGVYALGQADERHAERLQLVEQRDQV
jgi:hypothetical protein